MKKALTMVAVAAAILGFSASVQANQINGSLNFSGGTMTFNSTAVTSFGGSPVVDNNVGTSPTGDYIGTAGASVTFVAAGFTFSPSLGIVNPLWKFTVGGTVYSFALNSVTTVNYVAGDSTHLPSLSVQGIGLLHIDGFTDTTGLFTLTSTGAGPATFGFNAGNVAVPDGGNTLMLLGSALSVLGFGVFRKSRKA